MSKEAYVHIMVAPVDDKQTGEVLEGVGFMGTPV